MEAGARKRMMGGIEPMEPNTTDGLPAPGSTAPVPRAGKGK